MTTTSGVDEYSIGDVLVVSSKACPSLQATVVLTEVVEEGYDRTVYRCLLLIDTDGVSENRMAIFDPSDTNISAQKVG